MLNINIKDTVCRLDGYVVPQDFSCVKLNQNESPFDIPLELKQEISRRLLACQWNRYPNNFAEPLKNKISDYIRFSPSGLIVGNSSNELLQTVIYSVCDTGDTIVVSNPGFPIYNRIAAVMNIRVREVPLRSGFAFDTGRIIAAARGAGMVIIASPNNPTGSLLPLEDIAVIAGNIKGFLVMDEAYYEFCHRSARDLLEEYPNILIIRTFSKAFNLAGIRLGYMLGKDEIIRELNKSKLPFSVGVFQQLAGEVLLENRRFIRDNVSKILRERERVMRELQKIPTIKPFPSYANFILFQSLGIPGKVLFQRLYKKGVVLRHFETPELNHCLRVTIGSARENMVFLEKLREVIKEAENTEVYS
jgi:histidinol-phosphate aminotransferase